jgi:hypothetical protein
LEKAQQIQQRDEEIRARKEQEAREAAEAKRVADEAALREQQRAEKEKNAMLKAEVRVDEWCNSCVSFIARYCQPYGCRLYFECSGIEEVRSVAQD